MYVTELIRKIRQRTGRTIHSESLTTGDSFEGTSDAVIIDSINEAKDFIQAAIIGTGSIICDVFTTIPVVSQQQSYTINDRVHLGNRIRNVQYSIDSREINYRDLPQLRDEQRRNFLVSIPHGYIRRGLQLDLVGVPNLSGASIRPFYPRQWDDLYKRCGKISAKTSTTVNLTTWTEQGVSLNPDDAAFSLADYFCVVDSTGNVKDYNIPLASYDPVADEITMPSSTTLVGDVDDFVVPGQYCTTHLSFLPSPLVLQYIKIEAQMRLYDQRSSIEAIRENSFLTRVFNSIMEGYQDELLDEQDVPLSDPTLY